MSTTVLRDLKITIGVPSTGAWCEQFAISFTNMNTYFMKYKVPGYTSQLTSTASVKGSILSRSRHRIVRQAQKDKSTHLLFLDSDQSFPPDLIHRWVGHNVDVVAANVATKTVPAMPTARRAPKVNEPGFGIPVYTDASSKGLEKVWRVGTGLMLIKMDVFSRITEPLFEVRYMPDVDDYQGEDWSMVEAFARAGVDLWIDHDVSKKVGHWGTMNYTHDLAGEIAPDAQERFLVAQGGGR